MAIIYGDPSHRESTASFLLPCFNKFHNFMFSLHLWVSFFKFMRQKEKEVVAHHGAVRTAEPKEPEHLPAAQKT
jgi:hypothetical protein